MQHGIIYCYCNDENVIRKVEVIDAKNIEDAFDKTNCDVGVNTIIPLNQHNKKMLKRLTGFLKQRVRRTKN